VCAGSVHPHTKAQPDLISLLFSIGSCEFSNTYQEALKAVAMAALSCCVGLSAASSWAPAFSSSCHGSDARSSSSQLTAAAAAAAVIMRNSQMSMLAPCSRISCADSFHGLSSLQRIQIRLLQRSSFSMQQRRKGLPTPSCESISNNSSGTKEKVPFGYTRKDVLLIGVGLTVFGVGLKFGLEAFGVDSLKAGNVVQIVMVAGLTIGWISSYIFRVSTKDMTYAKQLKDYENKVMEKRLEELPEAELETLLAQIEEEKIRIQEKRDKKISS
jgi:hypothetical protein